MKPKLVLFYGVLFLCLTTGAAPLSNLPENLSDSVALRRSLPPMGKMHIRDLEQMKGRKLKLKEKIAFWVLKSTWKRAERRAAAGRSEKPGMSVFRWGLFSLGFLALALSIPSGVAIILGGTGALISSIQSLHLANKLKRGPAGSLDPNQRSLTTVGVIFSLITLSLIALAIVGGVAIATMTISF